MARYPFFVGPSYTSQSRIAACDRCVNLYPEKIEAPGGKAEWVLYPAPGFELFATLPAGPVRGFLYVNGIHYAVGGDRLYSISSTGTVTELATGINNIDGSPVTMHSNGFGGSGQVFIVAGSKGYTYDPTAATLTLTVDGATFGGFVDGFFLALDSQESKLYISDSFDGLTWDPSQVAQRNDAPDQWGSMLVANKEIWLFGSHTSGVYYNAGASPFPFLPNPSVFIQHGILAPKSAAIVDNAPMWLSQGSGGSGVVFRANGYTPVRVSTHALEYALSTYSTLVDAEAWTYQDQGHSFYLLSFPTAGVTWVYDALTGAWHERGLWDGNTFGVLTARCHAFAFGRHLVGSRDDGKIYRMGIDLAEDVGGAEMRRMRRAPHLSDDGKLTIFDRLRLDFEAGLGLSSGQGSDPQFMLRWSDDGGQTWGNEHWVSAGAQGQFRARAEWHRLGASRDRVFELSMSDPIPWRIINAYVEARGGRA